MRILACLLALLALPASAAAAQETFAWDYGAGAITGFKFYCGTAPGAYGTTPLATTTATVKQVTVTLPAGRQFCVVRAYDATGESGNSNEVSVLERPSNLRVVVSLVWDDARQMYALFVSEIEAVQ